MKWIIYIFTLCIFTACNNTSEPNDTIDVKSGILNINEISHFPLIQISQAEELKDANVALFLFINTDNYKNTQPEPYAIYTQAIAVFNNTNVIDYTSVDGDELIMTTPVIFPQYFTSPSKWKAGNIHKFGQSVNWLFKYHNLDLISIVDSFQTKIHPLYLNCSDTLATKESVTMKWRPSDNPKDKLYLSFKIFASFTQATATREISGFVLDDNGEYTFTPEEISQLSLPNYGIIQFILTRYRINTATINKRKIVLISISESYVSTYLPN